MPTNRLKLLAIDDCQDNLTTLDAVVREALPGCSLLTVLDGPSGIELARAEDPDVILLDLVMPGMDGFDVCRRLKADERLSMIPVIFLTALQTDRESRVKALEVGAGAFLSKPIDEMELVAQVRAMAKVKAANRMQRMVKEELSSLVYQRTRELEHELAERKRDEVEMQNLRTAVEQSANTIVITSPQGIIEYVNPAFEKVSGFTAAEAIGQNPRVLKSGEQDATFYLKLWTTITSGRIWRGEFHNRHKDGSLYWESATISPVFDDKGDILRFIAVKEVITDRKILEAHLHEALIRAEAAASAKADFLSVMSHELRTPLNGVLGFTEILADTPLSEAQKMYVNTIRDSGNHLLAVVDDILDFTSIEKGHLKIHAAPFTLDGLVKSFDLAIQKSATDKAIEFRCEVAPGVPDQIVGDERRIRQILFNLLENAVKFTLGGSVILRVSTLLAGGRSILNFSVEDTGIGISPETLARLFHPFTQGDSTIRRQFGGSGLGLAISKRLAEAMDGSISVVSTPGKGSLFTFWLPLESSSQGGSGSLPICPDQPGAVTPPPSAGDLVLVVEDDPTSSKLMGATLIVLGYQVEFADNGHEALQAFRKGKFSAILMDMQMPVMDGLVATQKIREVEAVLGGHVPIIALTANVMPGDPDRCLAAGMDAYLSKPFKKSELAAMLAQANHGNAASK